jgi:DNA-binding NtrC family response regulator
MERALVLCEGGEITVEHLPLDKLRLQRVAPPAPAAPARGAITPVGEDGADDPERKRILEAMAAFGGNQTRVAAKLGIARGTLIARLERYGIKRPQAARKRAR